MAIPESIALRADNKTFYFDCGSNPRGIFLRISEVIKLNLMIIINRKVCFWKVRPSRFRSAITIPEKFWDQFVSNMKEFINKIEHEKASQSEETNLKNNV